MTDAIGQALFGGAAEEIRLRTGRPVQIVYPDSDLILETFTFTREDARELLKKLCGYSVYSREEELKNGFVTLDGGMRVGVCGKPVTENGTIKSLTDVTCFNIRIAREVTGCAECVMNYIIEHGKPVSTLIAAPPAGGKTTLLRDIARCLSNGRHSIPLKVAIADERGELAGCIDGVPSFDIGVRTDIMELLPKAEAVGIFVRTMSPDVIITDEIGGRRDADALIEAAKCGVAVIASAHASLNGELKSRRDTAEILDSGIFKRVLHLRRSGSLLHISPLKV